MQTRQTGFSLIELIVFIVVIGLIAVGILMPIGVALRKTSNVEEGTQALLIAQQRMELVIGQRYINGFDSFTDPCIAAPSVAVCQVPTGYSVDSVTIASWGATGNFKSITVTVSGNGNAQLQTLVSR